jgi:hypothetical protein
MNRVIGFGVAIVLALGFAFVFWRYFEQVTEREYVGLQGEAARNRYLAAERFLRHSGHSVNRLLGLGQFDQMPSTAVLLWSRVPSEGERARLLDWVRRGGHLILNDPQSQKILLKEISVGYYWPEADADEPADETADEATNTTDDEVPQAVDAQQGPGPEGADPTVESAPVAAPDGTTVAKHACGPGRFACAPPTLVTAGDLSFMLELDTAARLRAPAGLTPRRSAHDESGAEVLLDYLLERGHITVLADDRYFHNDRIGDHDHAAWLSYVIGAPERPVWFADVPLAMSLPQWLRQHAWPALLAAAMAITLGLWRALVRFGPLLPDQAPGRLSFRDHLVACGRFHWRHAAADHLLQSVEREAGHADLSVAADADKKAPARRYAGRAIEAPAFVQRVKTLQRRLRASGRGASGAAAPPHAVGPVAASDQRKSEF